jgi:hypothetical protein
LRGTTDPAYEPLRLLVGEIRSGGDLATLWASARRVLDRFGGAAGGAAGDTAAGPRRAGFWKR